VKSQAMPLRTSSPDIFSSKGRANPSRRRQKMLPLSQLPWKRPQNDGFSLVEFPLRRNYHRRARPAYVAVPQRLIATVPE